ncbi:hypothetical protein C8R46DRAFT_1131117 [Mycena filopes]|nr:hypothetical protein C8R46DRAFT_1131117 [Mycena filopes]
MWCNFLVFKLPISNWVHITSGLDRDWFEVESVISKASDHPLSDDILDRVLTLLSDFESLRATILSSKAAYAVFTARPQSIIHCAVAENLLGPALLPAIHLIRNIPPESSYENPHTHKDRSTKSNKLSAVESFRFIRALYRIMLFADVFLGSCTPGLHHNVGPEDDLLEIGTVGFFIGDLGRWLKRKGFNPKNSKSAHPQRARTTKLDPQMIDDYFGTAHLWAANHWRLFDNHVHGPLWTVLRDRGELHPWAHPLCSKYILGYVEGQDDLYWELQNDANLAFRPFGLEQLRMPGFLKKNLRERDAWLVHIKDVPLHELLHDLFEVKTEDYSSLNPQGKTCKPCLTRFIDVHTHLWLLQRKRRAGEYIPEDCGRGYRCREQFRNPNHAVEFNVRVQFLLINSLCAPS